MVDYLIFIAPWYLLTVALEAPWIIAGIKGHSLAARIFWAFALTAFTYPFITIVFPAFIENRTIFIIVAETFAALGEAALFWAVADRKSEMPTVKRNALIIVLANMSSYAAGELLKYMRII